MTRKQQNNRTPNKGKKHRQSRTVVIGGRTWTIRSLTSGRRKRVRRMAEAGDPTRYWETLKRGLAEPKLTIDLFKEIFADGQLTADLCIAILTLGDEGEPRWGESE